MSVPYHVAHVNMAGAAGVAARCRVAQCLPPYSREGLPGDADVMSLHAFLVAAVA